jgi:hypothetical protein
MARMKSHSSRRFLDFLLQLSIEPLVEKWRRRD